MANETTSTSITELVNSEWIRPVLGAVARAKANCARFCLPVDLRGRATATAALPRENYDFPEASLGNLDIASETTEVANTEFQTTEATVSVAEYGVRREVTDTAIEDSIMGMSLYDRIIESGAADLAVAIDDDTCALFNSLATSVGSTGVPLSLAVMAQAVAQLRANDMPVANGAVFVLDSEAANEYDAALVAATGTALANYFTKPEQLNGLADGYLGTWMGQDIWTTSLTDTINAGADVSSALFVRGDEGRNPTSACFALATAREPTPELERNASLRTTEVVITSRKGVVEWHDLSGVEIVSDAP